MSGSITMVGNWRAGMETSLRQALNVRMDVTGRSAARACRDAIIFMAQSARKLTLKGVKKRPVENNPSFMHLINKAQYKSMAMAGKHLGKYYKYRAKYLQQDGKDPVNRYANTEKYLAKIAHVGLAKRSWMWGLQALGKAVGSKPIPGVGTMRRVFTKTTGAFILTNKLKYIEKIFPDSFRKQVEQLAVNRIMKQAEMKMQRDWAHAHPTTSGAGETFNMAKYINEAA